MKPTFFQQINDGSNEQIICFPYLGGYINAFTDIASYLDDSLDIWGLNPPGHGSCSLQPLETITEMVELCERELHDILAKKCTFFGYSMGGIVAYFLAQKILRSDHSHVEDIQLVLASCNPPNDFEERQYSHLSDDGLIDHLLSYNGIPEELTHEKSLLEYFLPAFRADFKVLENAGQVNTTPIAAPTHVLWGEDDPIVSLESVTQWSDYVHDPIHIIPIENGSHMFIHDKTDMLAHQLNDIVSGFR